MEVWSKDILVALQAATGMPEIVTRYDTDVKRGGDLIHLPRIAARTATTLSNTATSITFTSVTETEFQLGVATEAYDAFSVRDILATQAAYDLREKYTMESGKAVRRKQDADMITAALAHTLVTLQVGTTANTTTRIAATFLSRAMMLLDVQNNAPDERFLVTDGYGKGLIMELDTFIRYDATGKANGPIITGKVGTYYGLDVYMNNNCATTITSIGGFIAYQKSALAMALQKNVAVTAQYDINADAMKVLVKSIYGVGVAYTAGVVKGFFGTSGL